ncbi:YitT family protein [Clostridium sp. 'White wine YQ']|uniref:YitT family protein n=1 Tax=Clostridium sp. 'White wine YQ' TaxID=3027474 RepID=UPI0023664A94|nr:YitT family protein [Clostridium sp. 'White wine YQ']MDD7795657.1 YitT family protein [Clostridium sp. 'White wine YQ']
MKKYFKENLLITIGILLTAIALEYFFYPNNIAAGGISGLALVLNKIFGISPGLILIIANIILFALAFMLIGGNFGGKSIYASFGLSLVLWLIEKYLSPTAVTHNLVLATVAGSVISSLGIAMVFSQNSSTGGTSIIAKIINKYLHLDIGKCLLITDFIITILAIYTFGVDLGMFGLISVFLIGSMVDKFIEGFNVCKQVFIISSKGEEIVKYILNEVDRGCTVLDGTGGYSKANNQIIFTVVNRRQFIKLKFKIKEIDPRAFITVNDVREVLGEGFTMLGAE